MEPVAPISADVKTPVKRSHLHRWPIILVLCVAGISQNGSGKTVIVLVRDNNVWMAADSLAVGGPGQHRSICEITRARGFYWAAASPIYENRASHSTIAMLMSRIQATQGTLLQKMQAFSKAAEMPITAELERYRAANRARFEAVMKTANHDLLKVIYVGVENRVPTVVWATFIAQEANGRIVVSTDSLKSVVPAEVQDGVVGAGFTKDAIAYLRQHHWEAVSDPVPLLRQSLLAAENANPDAVGGPVSILGFTEKGEHWIDNGQCLQQ